MFEGARVGHVGLDEQRFTFAYDEAWLARDQAFPLSLRLPLQAASFGADEAHPFFSNLLPEGSVRDAIARRLKLSVDNDYALLRALGGDCAGAFNIFEATDSAAAGSARSELRPLPLEIFERSADAQSVYAAVVGEGSIRLSLAGAQDKLPVYVDTDDRLYVPVGAAASNAILKVPSPTLKHLPENETYMSLLATRLGLETCPTRLVPTGKRRSALVMRYDRALRADGTLARIHQEDLCQATGVPPSRKYESEGGPSFAAVYGIVQSHSIRVPKDPLALLTWLVFSLLAGNADGHAKNVSLVYERGGLRLAPFYDLVCTRIYPGIDRHHAMKIGARTDPGEIAASDWRALAEELGIGARFLLGEVRRVAERLVDDADEAAREFRERFGPSPILAMLRKQIRDQTKRSLFLL